MKFNDWLTLSESMNSADRLRCIDEIPNLSNEQIVPVLLKLLADGNELVRTCAAEMLVEYSNSHQEIIKSSLKRTIEQEESALARAYAMVSFCQMANDGNDLIFVSRAFQLEQEPYVKLHVSFGLFLISQKLLMDGFSENLQSEELKIKTSAINLIRFMYESIYFHRTQVIASLTEKLVAGENLSVSETIKEALQEIQDG